MALLKSLKTKGSLGLHYGMGVDEVEVNFDGLDGLITLAGSNGHGKTTFLEMLSPFPVFPSKKLKDPRRYNFKNQFQLKDSFKEVTYLHNGHEYIFRIEIPATTKTKSPEGYIWEDGTPLVKGKISQYKKKVEELFGTETLFYSSVFSCQGGKKLTDMPVGEFKQLLIELLGLKKYTRYFDNTKKCLEVVNASLAEVDRDLDRLGEKENQVNELRTTLEGHETALYTETSQKNTADTHINILTQETESLTKRVVDAEKKEAVIKEKEIRVKDLEEEMRDVFSDSETEKSAYGKHVENYNATMKPHRDLVAMTDDIRASADGIKKVRAEETVWNEQARILTTRRQGVVSDLDIVKKHLTDIATSKESAFNDPELSTLSQDELELSGKIETGQRDLAHNKQMLGLLDMDTATMVLEKELEGFSIDDSLLQQRPENCGIDECPFIQNALKSIPLKEAKVLEIAESKKKHQGKLDGLDKEKAALEGDLKEFNDSMTTITTKIDARQEVIKKLVADLSEKEGPLGDKKEKLDAILQDIDKEYAEVTQYLDGVPARVKTLEALASKVGDLDSAEKVISHAVETLSEKKKDHENLLVKLRVKYKGIQDKVNALREEIFKDGLIASSSALKEELEKAMTTKKNWENAMEATQEKIQELEKSIAVCKESIKIADQHGEEIIRLKHRRVFLLEELNKWSYIRDAVSKSGLQALEIASAAPLMTSKANDLLHAAYGGEFFLDLVTIDPETGAEILDIMVTRGDGKTFPLFTYSGGESVWILQAFKAAQILVNAEKSGIHFATCFADEESGALDKDKAERFIQMYRALMDQGKFKKLFYISHIPECQAMADHSLVFESGGIKSESNISM